MWVAAVVALVATAEPLRSYDAFLDGDGAQPRSVDVDGRAREVARGVFIAQWEPRTGVPTSVWLPAPARGERPPRAQGLSAEDVARRALFALAPLYKASPLDLARAPLAHVHDLGTGAVVVSFVRRVGEVPVFRERVAVVLTHELEPVGVLGALPAHAAPPLGFPLSAETALGLAVEDVTGRRLGATAPRAPSGPGAWASHGEGSRSRQVLYATATELLPAWQLEVDLPTSGWAVVVSARDGRVLSRATRDLDATFSYRVWAKTTAPFTPLDSPEGDTLPHPTGQPDGWAPAMLSPSELVSLDHAGLATMDPWLPAGALGLAGNNAVAYADLYAPDGRNDPQAGLPRLPDGGQPPGEALPDGGSTRNLSDPFPAPTAGAFDFRWSPAIEPTATDTQSHAAATHAFFVANWWHDRLYGAGFTEPAGNAQADNKGRGGRSGDPLLVEVNDFEGVNSATTRTTADGASPRLQLFPVRLLGRATVDFVPPLGVDAGLAAPPMGASAWNVTAAVVGVVSADGGADVCGPWLNAGAVAGRVALARASGPCGSIAGLDDLAADAGAVGLLLVDGFDTRAPGLTVPTHVLDAARADALRLALDAGTVVTATLERVPAAGRAAAFDTTLLVHELGHVLTSRLVADGSGLLSNQSRALGEGWSDFLALLATLEAADAQRPGNADWRGAWAIAGHTVSPTGYDGAPRDAHYFGVRRFPYSTDPGRNALTLRHIVTNVPLPTSAPMSPYGGGGPDNAQLHNAGEVWASALWEGTTRLLRDPRTSSVDVARDRVLALLVASLKATPVNPTFLEARDAVLMAARATGAPEFEALLGGFAARGMGLAAQVLSRRSPTNAPVAEDFTATGAGWALLDVRATDDADECDNDGVLDVGEQGLVQLTLMNIGSRDLTNSRLTLAPDPAVLTLGRSSVTVSRGEPFALVQVALPAEVAGGVAGVALSRVIITSSDPLLEQAPVTRFLRLNSDVVLGAKEGFEADVLQGADPWRFERDGVPWEYQFRVNMPARLLENTLVGPNAPVAGLSWATTPTLRPGPGAFGFTFTQSYAFEFDRMNQRAYDGAQLRLSVDDGPFLPIPAAAISRVMGAMVVTGYDGVLEAGSGNPLAGQSAFTNSGSNQRVTVSLGTQYAGARVRVQFVIGTDTGGASTGWVLDDLEFTGLSSGAPLPFSTVVTHRAQCVNKPPVLQTAFPQLVDERTRVTLLPPPASDPNQDPLTFRWVQTSGPTVQLAGDQFDAPEVRADTQLVFTVTADDGRGGMASQAAVVVVRNVNRAPTSSAGETQTVESGQTVTLAGRAEDEDGDVLVIRWAQLGGPPVTLSSVDALDATFIAPQVETPSQVNFELNVSDGPAAAPPQQLTILVTPKRGCGCASVEGVGALVALLAWARRRRR